MLNLLDKYSRNQNTLKNCCSPCKMCHRLGYCYSLSEFLVILSIMNYNMTNRLSIIYVPMGYGFLLKLN